MDRWLISFCLGALLSLFLPITPSLFYVVFFTVLSLLCFSVRKLRLLATVLLGITWLIWHGAAYHGIWQVNGLNKNTISQEYLTVIARVTTIASIKDNRARFHVDIDEINSQKLNKSINARVSWLSPEVFPQQGQVWQLTMKVRPAHGFANPGGFNYLTWLKQQHIHATGFVKNKAPNKLITNEMTWRAILHHNFSQLLPATDSAGLILALTFGDKSLLKSEQWQVLTRTATNHLMAISGLHLGLVALATYAGLTLLLKAFPINRIATRTFQHRLLVMNSHTLVLASVFLLTSFYAYLAGFSTPTIRALVMLLVFMAAQLLSIQLGKLRLLLVSLTLIIIFAPFSLFSVSFWLSFGAVSLIFLYLWRIPTEGNQHSTKMNKVIDYFKCLSVFQLYLILALLPVTASLSYNISLVAIFANLIAVPWLSFIVVPLVLLSLICSWLLPPLADLLLGLSIVTMDLVWAYLAWLSSYPWGQWTINQHLWLIVTAILVVGLWLFVVHVKGKQALIICSCITLMFALVYLNSGRNQKASWYVDVLDVGQGLAIAIRANNKLLLYDTAASFPSGFSMAESVIVPYMRYHGFSAIDLLIISHDDNDHAGGVKILKQHFPVVNEISNEEASGKPCLKGEVFNWQTLHITILHPDEEKADHNDDSCVINISDGEHSILLTGDISTRIEKRLVKSSLDTLKADVMVVPHHGSKSSSSAPFIHAVAPKAAIFSAGYLNRWNMPSKQVKDRYAKQHVITHNTAEQGMISISFAEQSMTIRTYRQDIWPFWFAN